MKLKRSVKVGDVIQFPHHCFSEQRRVPVSTLFEFNVERAERDYREFKVYEDAGEKVCWSEDTALLLDKGIIGGDTQ